MKFAQRTRSLRKPFGAAIGNIELHSERQLSTRTSDLSLDPCFVPTHTHLNPGVKVQIPIVYGDAKVVASALADGMGITFTKIEQRDQSVLEQWINDLRLN